MTCAGSAVASGGPMAEVLTYSRSLTAGEIVQPSDLAFGKVPRAAVLPAGDPTVPLNSCYVLSCDDVCDAYALTALLNGPLAAAWLNAIAEPARGGWHRYLAWTVSLLPLPNDWARARSLLAPLTERALGGSAPTNDELLAKLESTLAELATAT